MPFGYLTDTGTNIVVDHGDYPSSNTLERQHAERYRSTMRGQRRDTRGNLANMKNAPVLF